MKEKACLREKMLIRRGIGRDQCFTIRLDRKVLGAR
jgi:hypothetical protein